MSSLGNKGRNGFNLHGSLTHCEPKDIDLEGCRQAQELLRERKIPPQFPPGNRVRATFNFLGQGGLGKPAQESRCLHPILEQFGFKRHFGHLPSKKKAKRRWTRLTSLDISPTFRPQTEFRETEPEQLIRHFVGFNNGIFRHRRLPVKRFSVKMSNIFSGRLKTARHFAGLNQKALADKLKVNEGTISRWERGLNPPSAGDIALIASCTGVSAPWLEFGEEPMTLPALPGDVEKGTIPGLATHPFFSDPWQLLEEVIQARGMKLSDDERVKIVFLAAAKAIMEKRDPVRKDVIDSLGAVLNLE